MVFAGTLTTRFFFVSLFNYYMKNSTRLIFITGATSGIGEAIAQAFARDGAQVIATGATEQEVQKASSLANSKGIDFRVLDVRDDAAVQSMSANINAECKRRFIWLMLTSKHSILVSRSYQNKLGLTLG